jgi:C-methyltransferase
MPTRKGKDLNESSHADVRSQRAPVASKAHSGTGGGPDIAALTAINHLAHASWLSRCLHAVTRLGVADLVEDQPIPYDVVAEAIGAHPAALRRAIRCLAAYGVFNDFGSAVSHNEASRLLRCDHPWSQASVVKWAGSPIQWEAYGNFEQVLLSGEAALNAGGLFDALSRAPGEAEHFNLTMEASSLLQVRNISSSFDFAKFGTICDVGGGRGHLLRAILERAPESFGVLVDLPAVIEALPAPGARTRYEALNILNEPVPSADAYVLKHVLHDWSDQEVVTILKNIRGGLGLCGKLIVAETLLPEPPHLSLSLIHDVAMMIVTGGRERTHQEFLSLLQAAGLTCEKVIPLGNIGLIIAQKER